MKERVSTRFSGGREEGDDIQQKGEVQNFGHEWEEPTPLPHLVANLDPPIKNILRSVLDLISVIILKRVREYFLSKKHIYSL